MEGGSYRGHGRPKGSDQEGSDLGHSGASRKGQRCMSDGCPWMQIPRTAAVPQAYRPRARTPRSLPEEVRNSGRDVLCKHRKPSKHGISSNGSEEASDPLESNASQTEPNAFLFLLPTLVWHPQLTDGYFPAFQNNGSSQKGSTSSLASPVPDLHKQADACKGRLGSGHPPAPSPGRVSAPSSPAHLLSSPREEPHQDA